VLERLAGCTTLVPDHAEILSLAASLDQVSGHVLAAAVVRAAAEHGSPMSQPAAVTEVAGQGITGTVGGRVVRLGRAGWAGAAETEPWVKAARRRARLDGALTVFAAVDGQPAGVLLLEDRIRPDARQTIRAVRQGGISRIVLATGDRAEAADAVGALTGVDEVIAELTPADKLDVVRREQRLAPVIMTGDGINDAPALALADVGIAMQSVLAGMGMSLAAMGVAAAGMLPAVWGALLQEAIDVAVILNALRALVPAAPEVRLTAADTDLTRRFRAEHQAIRADIDQLRTAAETLTAPGAMARVRRACDLLTSEVWPHEHAEELDLYPALNRVLGGVDPTAPMSRAHAEIAVQIARLGRLTDDIGDREPDDTDIAELRGLLYGLHAILRLHTAQEDETYLSLGDTADTSRPAA
jgi:hypothetical protein